MNKCQLCCNALPSRGPQTLDNSLCVCVSRRPWSTGSRARFLHEPSWSPGAKQQSLHNGFVRRNCLPSPARPRPEANGQSVPGETAEIPAWSNRPLCCFTRDTEGHREISSCVGRKHRTWTLGGAVTVRSGLNEWRGVMEQARRKKPVYYTEQGHWEEVKGTVGKRGRCAICTKPLPRKQTPVLAAWTRRQKTL